MSRSKETEQEKGIEREEDDFEQMLTGSSSYRRVYRSVAVPSSVPSSIRNTDVTAASSSSTASAAAVATTTSSNNTTRVRRARPSNRFKGISDVCRPTTHNFFVFNNNNNQKIKKQQRFNDTKLINEMLDSTKKKEEIKIKKETEKKIEIKKEERKSQSSMAVAVAVAVAEVIRIRKLEKWNEQLMTARTYTSQFSSEANALFEDVLKKCELMRTEELIDFCVFDENGTIDGITHGGLSSEWTITAYMDEENANEKSVLSVTKKYGDSFAFLSFYRNLISRLKQQQKQAINNDNTIDIAADNDNDNDDDDDDGDDDDDDSSSSECNLGQFIIQDALDAVLDRQSMPIPMILSSLSALASAIKQEVNKKKKKNKNKNKNKISITRQLIEWKDDNDNDNDNNNRHPLELMLECAIDLPDTAIARNIIIIVFLTLSQHQNLFLKTNTQNILIAHLTQLKDRFDPLPKSKKSRDFVPYFIPSKIVVRYCNDCLKILNK